MPIDHFVIVMMENRSFDHYFGWLSDLADGIQDQTYTDPVGQPGADAPRLDARGRSGRAAATPIPATAGRAGGRSSTAASWPRAAATTSSRSPTTTRATSGFIHPAAREFTVYDRFFCSLLGPTWPNRYYKWSAQSGGKKNNDPPAGDGRQPVGDDLRPRAGEQPARTCRAPARSPPATTTPTCPSRPSGAPAASPGPGRSPSTTPTARPGTLPNISIVDPPFRDGGGGDGLSADEHPHGDVRLGQAWMSDVAHAFMESPNYRRGAMFIIYDEWGGFFDHVRPPSVPDDRAQLRPERGLRPDGLPHPGGGDLALRPQRRLRGGPGQPRPARARVDPEADHLPLRARRPRHPRRRARTTSARASTGTRPTWSRPTCPTRRRSPRRPARSAATPTATCPRSCRPSTSGTSRTSRTWRSRHGFQIGDGKVDKIFRAARLDQGRGRPGRLRGGSRAAAPAGAVPRREQPEEAQAQEEAQARAREEARQAAASRASAPLENGACGPLYGWTTPRAARSWLPCRRSIRFAIQSHRAPQAAWALCAIQEAQARNAQDSPAERNFRHLEPQRGGPGHRRPHRRREQPLRRQRLHAGRSARANGRRPLRGASAHPGRGRGRWPPPWPTRSRSR